MQYIYEWNMAHYDSVNSRLYEGSGTTPLQNCHEVRLKSISVSVLTSTPFIHPNLSGAVAMFTIPDSGSFDSGADGEMCFGDSTLTVS